MRIAEEVVAALRASGFTVAAPQNEDQRIEIAGLVWQKRSPEDK